MTVELEARESDPAAASVPQGDSQNAGMDIGSVSTGGGGGAVSRDLYGCPDKKAAPRTRPVDYCESYQSVQHEIATLLSVLGCPAAKTAVSEVFSPGRFTKRAGVFGLIPGMAFGLRTDWDLSDDQQQQCWDQIEAEDPYLVIRGPICKAFFQL